MRRPRSRGRRCVKTDVVGRGWDSEWNGVVVVVVEAEIEVVVECL